MVQLQKWLVKLVHCFNTSHNNIQPLQIFGIEYLNKHINESTLQLNQPI